MKDIIELDPYARPIDWGPDVGPIPLRSSIMTQAPRVRLVCLAHKQVAQAPCVCLVCQHRGRQPKHHVCAGVCPTHK